MIMCLRYVRNPPAFLLMQSSPLRFPNSQSKSYWKDWCVSFSVGGQNTSKKRPFRRSLAASWDSKRRSLEEDFARKEQELRSEQVPKTGWKGWWSQNLSPLLPSPKKPRRDVAFVWVGLIWPWTACIPETTTGTQNQMQCRHTNGSYSPVFGKFAPFLGH